MAPIAKLRDRVERILEEIWYGRAPWTLALLFVPLGLASLAVRLGGAWRRRRPRAASPIPTVSIGNLLVGGSGKTQAVLELCRRAVARGIATAIVSRGYGGSERGPLEVPLDGLASRFGDEPVLVKRRFPGAVVIVARDRAAGARLAAERGGRLLILDDGLQQRSLEPGRSAVLFPGECPLGNGFLLPLGPLREPPSRLAAGDLIWVHGEGEGRPPREAQIRSRTVAVGLVDARRLDGPTRAVAGRSVAAFSGIARPERFFRTLEGAGARILLRSSRGDHRSFSRAELEAFAEAARALGAEALVCTEKDAVRLPPEEGGSADRRAEAAGPKHFLEELPLPLWALRVELRIELGEARVEELLA